MWGRAQSCPFRKFLEFKVLGLQHPLESVTKQRRVLAIVEPEAHLVKVRGRYRGACLDRLGGWPRVDARRAVGPKRYYSNGGLYFVTASRD